MALKGIAFNDSTITTQTITTGDVLDVDGSMTVAQGITVEGSGVNVTGNSTILGNLTVSGNLISQDAEQVLIKDNFLDLNVGYVGTAYEQTGLTFNYQGISGKVFTINSGTNGLTFVATTNGARASLTLAGGTVITANTFAVNDILQISGTTDGENDGIYIVHSQGSNNEIFIKSQAPFASPDVVNSAFALLDFTAQTQSSGSVTVAVVNLMALRSSSTGQLQSATGDSDTNFSSYSAVGADTSLQNAYAAGNTITTASSQNITFTLTSGNFDIQGTGSLLIGNSTAVSAFGVTTSGTSTITSAGNSTLRSSGANVTVQSDLGTITNTCTSGTYTINATGQTVDINSATFDLDGSNIQINGSGAGNLTVNDELDIVSVAGNVDIDAAGDILGTAIGGAVTLGAADSSSFTVTGNNDASGTNLSLIAGNNGSSTASVSVQAKTSIGNTVGGVAKLTISTTATTHNQNVTFDTTGGLNFETETVVINSIKDENNMVSDSATALATQQSIKAYVDSQISDDNLTFAGDSGGDQTVDLDTQKLTIAGTSNEIETSSSGQTLTVGLPNAVTLTTSLTSPLVNTAAVEAQDSTAAITIANTTGAVAVSSTLALASGTSITEFSTDATMGGDSDNAVPTEKAVAGYVTDKTSTYSKVTMVANETIAVGDVVSIVRTGGVAGRGQLANAGNSQKQDVIGICVSGGNAGDSIEVAQIGLYNESSAFVAGSRYYLHTTDGQINTTVPSSTGDVVFQIGFATTANDLIIQPRFIMELS